MNVTFLDRLDSKLRRRGEARLLEEDSGALEKRGSRVPFQESGAKNRAVPFNNCLGTSNAGVCVIAPFSAFLCAPAPFLCVRKEPVSVLSWQAEM